MLVSVNAVKKNLIPYTENYKKNTETKKFVLFSLSKKINRHIANRKSPSLVFESSSPRVDQRANWLTASWFVGKSSRYLRHNKTIWTYHLLVNAIDSSWYDAVKLNFEARFPTRCRRFHTLIVSSQQKRYSRRLQGSPGHHHVESRTRPLKRSTK